MAFTMYFAGSQGPEMDKIMLDMGCDKLYSQLNDRKHINQHLELADGMPNKIFIDSGAFTAKNLGKVVDLVECMREQCLLIYDKYNKTNKINY